MSLPDGCRSRATFRPAGRFVPRLLQKRILSQALGSALIICLLFSVPVRADVSMTTKDSLQAIKAWLEEHAPPLVRQLNSPASEDDIRQFESRSGIQLPASVRAAYRMHDGEDPSSQGLFGTWRWLPLDEVEAYRLEILSTGESLANNAAPVLMSGGGDFYYVESVDKPGLESPVIEWWHEQPTRDVRFDNFAALLHEFARGLERGQYVYLPDTLSGLIDKDEL